MRPDYEVFEQALTLFHRYSLQNDETVRQMQLRGVLPQRYEAGFSVLDIGAGQGYLPGLMEAYAGRLVLVEPNPRCVDVLKPRFRTVYPSPWGEMVARRIQAVYSEGFDLITMSHMLYHFDGLGDIREKIQLALGLLRPGGALAIIVNQPEAPMARIGTGFQVEEGRLAESKTNAALHAACHHERFYQELVDGPVHVGIYAIDTPLDDVASREELVKLFRMCLLNPLSEALCQTERLDAFINSYLDTQYPSLRYPATIPSQDDLILIQKTPSHSFAATS